MFPLVFVSCYSWDDFYERDLTVFADSGDFGEVWCVLCALNSFILVLMKPIFKLGLEVKCSNGCSPGFPVTFPSRRPCWTLDVAMANFFVLWYVNVNNFLCFAFHSLWCLV